MPPHASPWPAGPLQALGLDHPIIQAGLAGGPGGPPLVAAASEAGCLGTLGAAYLAPGAITEAGTAIRRLTARPFAINLFLPESVEVPAEAIARMNARLDVYRRELGIPLSPAIGAAMPPFDQQLDATLALRPAVVSFTFGCPSPELMARLRAASVVVMGTATCVREALALDAAGVDYIVAQGAESGGHRGTFPGTADPLVGTLALVPQVVDCVGVPVIAAGGIMDGRGIVAALALGAAGAQMGTAFLTAGESTANPAHRSAVLAATDESTSLTRAYSGRLARGITNRFMREWAADETALLPFPVQNALTRDIRQAAAQQNRGEFLSLWAGQAAALASEGSVRELVGAWAAQAGRTIGRLRP